MKLIFVNIILLFSLISNSFGQVTGANEVRKGNFDYKMESFDKAEDHYRKSIEKGIGSIQGLFNLGNALYKQKKYQESANIFKQITENISDSSIKAKAYHNLGNSMMKINQLKPAIEAYKNALRINPKDEDSRYNLMMALRQLKAQENNPENQNEDKQDQDQQQDKKNKDKQDQQEQQDKQNQDKQDQQDQQQDQQNKKENGQGNQQDQKEEQQENEEQSEGQPKPNQISKQEAQRMLDALDRNEKDIQDKLKMKKVQGKKEQIEKDW